jgi:hypothetical protein
MTTNVNNLSLSKKRKLVADKIELLPKQVINRIFDKYVSSSENSEEEKKKINTKSKKYKMALRIINAMLKNMEKEEIDDIFEFKNIPRKELLIKENYQYILDNAKEIFEIFDKKTFNYYYRKNHKNYMYVITFLKAMCKDLEIKFIGRYTTSLTMEKGKTLRPTFYSIKLI